MNRCILSNFLQSMLGGCAAVALFLLGDFSATVRALSDPRFWAFAVLLLVFLNVFFFVVGIGCGTKNKPTAYNADGVDGGGSP